ncbi:hypothetical protein NDU88_000260 [Pleurodeles waltl]|uniref:Uncharacterized protein n=1 Tax=Pleurodeles waltl TaxID=8319 RepID=A0AAV7P0U3_PLEWA|nr:hypothetical protein NDU88_000260 [Pleurodeles waltl]
MKFAIGGIVDNNWCGELACWLPEHVNYMLHLVMSMEASALMTCVLNGHSRQQDRASARKRRAQKPDRPGCVRIKYSGAQQHKQPLCSARRRPSRCLFWVSVVRDRTSTQKQPQGIQDIGR